MKPTQLNNHQIEALNNSCTMLWLPINISVESIEEACKCFGEINFIKSAISNSPLQIGQEYYVQEEIDCIGDCSLGLPCQSCGSSQGVGKVLVDANIKFKVTDIQVKRVQEISYRERCSMSIPKNGAYWEKDVENWHNKQYPNQPYKDNPYGFLVTIERLT